MTTRVSKASPRAVAAWQALHRLADAFVIPVRNRVMAVLQALSTYIPRAPLRLALEADDLVSAEAGIVAVLTDAAPALWHAALDLLTREVIVPAAEVTAGTAELALAFQVDPGIITLMEQYTGARIVQVSETTREAIRGILTRTTQANLPLRVQVQEIAGQIGLTTSQARTVTVFRQGLEDTGTPLARLEQLVQQRIQALKLQRALNIGRTETMSAANLGSQLSIVQNVQSGILQVSQVRRYWRTAEDEVVCVYCAPVPVMNPAGVGLMQLFQTPVEDVLLPPLHPACRCTIDYVIS